MQLEAKMVIERDRSLTLIFTPGTMCKQAKQVKENTVLSPFKLQKIMYITAVGKRDTHAHKHAQILEKYNNITALSKYINNQKPVIPLDANLFKIWISIIR